MKNKSSGAKGSQKGNVPTQVVKNVVGQAEMKKKPKKK